MDIEKIVNGLKILVRKQPRFDVPDVVADGMRVFIRNLFYGKHSNYTAYPVCLHTFEEKKRRTNETSKY